MPKVVSPRNDDNEFNVLSYGADPAGSADSSTAFSAAATAAQTFASSNGRALIKIPPGKYKLNSTFKVIGGNVTIEAYGAYIFAGNGQDLFRDWTSQDSSFTLNGRGLTILGGIWDCQGHLRAQGAVGGNAGYSGFTLSNSSGILIRDVTVRNVKAYHGIDLNTCNGITVDTCRFEGFKNSHEWKTNVRVATTVAGTLATSFANGQTVDGISLVTGDRILIKNQASGAENGIYTVNASGAPTRATDMPVGSTTAANDAAVKVTAGAANLATSWIQTTASVTVNTTAMVWASNWKLQCRLASTANVASLSGTPTIDGVATVATDRVLLKNQTTTSQNGIWVVAAGAWARAGDVDSAAEINGAEVNIGFGTANAGTNWVQTSTVVNINTDPVTWSTDFIVDRYFSESVQIDNGPNAVACKNITVNNCYMGPAADGSGLGSFGKMAGTHTDSSGQFYTNMKFTNNTSVGSLSNAFQGYSFGDSIISGNTIIGSNERGIRMFFNTGNSGPRLTISNNVITDTVNHGIEIDGGASQRFNDVSITGNVITSTVMATPGTGIHVDTCDRLNVANNSISLSGSPSSQQGIYAEGVNDGEISGNTIYFNGTLGMQIGATSNPSLRMNVVGNKINGSGDGGIWISGGSQQCLISNNHIVGANRLVTTSANGCIVISGTTTNNNNSISGNKFNKGTGVESTYCINLQGNSFTGTEIGPNNYGSDWNTNNYSNINSNNGNIELIGVDAYNVIKVASDFTLTAPTGFTILTGMTQALPGAGKYRIKGFINFSSTGTTVRFGIGGASNNTAGPTATLVNGNITIQTAAASGATTTHSCSGYLQTTSVATVATGTVLGCVVDGFVDISANGTLSLQGAVTSGNLTIKAGSAFILERMG